MKGYEPMMSFGEEIAGLYRDARRGDEEAAVAFLAEMAGPGPALELAIGAGRIALPLAARGVRVDGIDLSPAMVAQLRAKPGGDAIAVTIGDFADVPVPGAYRLVYVVWNTLFNLLTQDDQVRCFENVAAHLTDDGAFVIEAFHPGYLYALRDHQYVDAEAVEVHEVRLDVARHDPVKQLLEESHVFLSREGVRLNPIVTRYIWPSEMDLMARVAGLHLKERWAGWDRGPVAATSRNLVSVYGR
jgi:SAM-dependent methyltransferase